MLTNKGDELIGVIGLGYVGLPLAVLFSNLYSVVGYDYATNRIAELQQAKDSTSEVSTQALSEALQLYSNSQRERGLLVTTDHSHLSNCSIYIVAVPTPVDQNNLPDLQPLQSATTLIARYLQKGDLVIYESTVYPGCTEEVAVPILEKIAGLRLNEDFSVGYSPERINPGDKQRKLTDIIKVTSGSNAEATERVNRLYASVISAGTYVAPSIKIAEAAKVVENTQRDINIAFMNELSKVFTALEIDMKEVTKAAATKWNFLPFHPGLVGGHCIGVDPYYLIHRSKQAGYEPTLLQSARIINNSMGKYVADRMVQLLNQKKIAAAGATVLILGLTFKENTADIRNSRVFEVVSTLNAAGVAVSIFDPLVDVEQVRDVYGYTCLPALQEGVRYDGIMIAVPHDALKGLDYVAMLKAPGVLYDLKGILPAELSDDTM